MVPHVLVLVLAASALQSTCPKAVDNQCYNTGLAKNEYEAFDGKLAECCRQCVRDADLCAGYVHDGSHCALLSTWDERRVHAGSCTSGQIHAFPPVPPPQAPVSPPKGAKNVLFLMSDDMRPSIGPMGLKEARTPSMDRLAREGLTFARAYVQISYCAPSRNSFMSGRRPDATKTYSFMGHFRQVDTGMNWTSMPEHFRNHGYMVAGAGKLFHPNVPPDFDQPRSWSADFPYADHGSTAKNLCKDSCCGSFDDKHVCMWDLKNGTYLQDQVNTMYTKGLLKTGAQRYNSTGQPFFIGMGFHKPHLRWDFPKHFWDLIPPIPAATHQAFPADVPHLAWHECAECSTAPGGVDIAYFDTNGFGRPLPPQEWQSNMRRAYYATIAYVDSLIGELLDELDVLGMTDHTVVSFGGDHGWNLGEHDVWCKMTNFELGTRVPLLMRAPWKKNSVGVVTTALAEYVDFYPTLASLAGLPLPTGPGGEHLGGLSLEPVFDDPSATVRDVALSQFPRCWQNNSQYDGTQPGDERNKTNVWENMSDCHWMSKRFIDYMGYAMRTNEYRFVQWMSWNGTALRPQWDDVVGLELYDHTKEDQRTYAYMDETENENMAYDPANAPLVKALAAQLKTNVEKWIV